MAVFNKIIDRYIVNCDTGCWNWIGYKNRKGYGTVSVNNYPKFTHRLSYELYIGEIPDGMVVMHNCDNPSCVNPFHLKLGAYKDNVDDMISKNRRTWLGNRGESNGMHKLSMGDVEFILNSTDTTKELSDKYGTSWQTINNIRKNKTWKH